MTRTRNNIEQLGKREDKVEYLGNEEEEERLAKMTKYAYSCKSNPCGIGECISHEHFGRIAVVVKQGQRCGDEGNDDNRGENVVIHIIYWLSKDLQSINELVINHE